MKQNCEKTQSKTLKYVNKSNNENPTYADNGSSGFDLRAYITEKNGGTLNLMTNSYEISLKPLQRMMIHTGIYFDVPEGTEIQVRPRSGLAIKYGVTVLNSPGTIDADYRGEICVELINLSNKPYTIYFGDRIAQLVFNKYEQAKFIKVEELSETERGEGGFGHTGNK